MSIYWITYWAGTRHDGAVPASAIASEALTVSGSSAQSGPTPDAADFISLYADVAGNFAYDANPTASATTSHHVGANERLWFAARPGRKIAGITT